MKSFLDSSGGRMLPKWPGSTASCKLALAGQVREQADMLIAATAQIHALTLVTRNVRDFDGCGIAVLNPFTP